MEMKKFFDDTSYEFKINAKEIESPNNKQYEIRAEKLEEKMTQITIQKHKAYKEAEELLIY